MFYLIDIRSDVEIMFVIYLHLLTCYRIAIVRRGHPVHAHVSSRRQSGASASDWFPHSCSWEYLLCTPRVAPFVAPSLAPLRPSVLRSMSANLSLLFPLLYNTAPRRQQHFSPIAFSDKPISLSIYTTSRDGASGDRLHVKNIAHWEHAICRVGFGWRRILRVRQNLLPFDS